MSDANKVCLVIVEESETRLNEWRNRMKGIPARFVQVAQGVPPLRWLDENGEADCVIVPALWGLDITGVRPIVGQAQVLPAPSKVGESPIRRIQWVATPPALRGWNTTQAMDLSAEPVLDSYEWVYRIFLAVFQVIKEFNDIHLHKIRRLGFWGKDESFLSGLPQNDAAAVAAAYHECFKTGSFSEG